MEREWVYVALSKESKQNSTKLGFRVVVEHCWCCLLSGIGSFFSPNRRSLAALSLQCCLRNSQSSICLLLVPLNTEHMPRRPKGNERRGRKTGNRAV